jgi:N-succinyldiaminopimelate aminotransferase
MSTRELQQLIGLADQYDFVIASDECYSEIYPESASPPAGLLQAAAELGRNDCSRCMVFHSLSKRSNAPGLRSGFVAGDARLIENFLRYRTYHGCAMPPATQAASISAWRDEDHVAENRTLYTQKFAAVLDILAPVLDVRLPDAGFYLWPQTTLDDAEFARGLLVQQNVIVLPGSYLSREAAGVNPGSKHVRMALVAPLEDCIEAAERIKTYIVSL